MLRQTWKAGIADLTIAGHVGATHSVDAFHAEECLSVGIVRKTAIPVLDKPMYVPFRTVDVDVT